MEDDKVLVNIEEFFDSVDDEIDIDEFVECFMAGFLHEIVETDQFNINKAHFRKDFDAVLTVAKAMLLRNLDKYHSAQHVIDTHLVTPPNNLISKE